MKVLVVGGTGDLGSVVCQRAVEKGHVVRSLDITNANLDKLGDAKDKVEFVIGNVMDKSTLEPALEGEEAVVIALRLNEDQIAAGLTYYDVESEGVKNVVEIAKQKGVKKVVLISADGVGANSASDLYQAKFQAEEAVKNSGMDYTVFKSSGLFKDFLKYHIPIVFQNGPGGGLWPFGPLDFRMSPLSHVDLARCMADAVDNPGASNKSITMGGPDIITTKELLDMIVKVAGIDADYTQGVSKEQLIDNLKKNPGPFSVEQLEDILFDSPIEHGPIKEIFKFEFHRIQDFINEAVPMVKAAMEQQDQ
ncbi:MAG: NAD(P)H-binding protein [Proteobacteria bacterium]|nr:NAD(P)H-binding protein [Pseudomonadota bacterium]